MNPDYEKTYFFTNDFPALLPEPSLADPAGEDELYQWYNVAGTSGVK
ncbi:MAG: hypothetical protein HOD43_11120 [Candidatus Marinimicrobia bacterium]|nr:hypothetical protein [Candidatus Neomarinimicrobiota bacterium]MBT4296343.1 hypothetical protein [Candidatus Neomarinimicrobiota bacterium]MBT5314394.1 hypothetical protein [Candidatus Neomarinimicrobiota bacterium]MBT7829060.1 hypothetical protein [Candidatus Neomarinimicrobiota bacterium]